MSFTKRIRLESDKLKSIHKAHDNFHFEVAIYRVLDERINISASFVRHQEFQECMRFTHEIGESSDKLKSRN